MKVAVVWDVGTVYSPADGSEILTAGLMMEAVGMCETSVTLYQTVRRNIPQDRHRYIPALSGVSGWGDLLGERFSSFDFLVSSPRRCFWGRRPPIMMVAANILNQQSLTRMKSCSYSL
jgi:hypothetical protein